MKKRLTLVLLAFGILFSLFSCGKSFNDQDILENNISNYGAIESVVNTVDSFDFTNVYNISESYISQGLLILTYKDGSDYLQTVFSFLGGKELFTPKANISINIFSTRGIYYVAVEHLVNDTTVVYDVFGNVVISERKYENWYVSVSVEYDFVDLMDLNIYYIEEAFVAYEDLNGKHVSRKTYHEIDTQTSDRVEIEKKSDDSYIEEETIIDLAFMGLKGYYSKEMDTDTVYIYKKDTDKLVSSIYLDDGEAVGVLNGKVLIQKIHSLNPYNKEYTYIYEEDLYKHVISTVDLLTGKEKVLKTDYIIEDSYPLVDEDKNIKYLLAEIRRITSGLLHDESIFVTLDENGKIVKNYGETDLTDFRGVYNNHYINTNNDYLYNKDLEPLFQIRHNYQFFANQELIKLRYGFNDYGMIDYKGMIIVPFGHEFIADAFISDLIYAVDENDNQCLYDIEGGKTVLNENISFINDGLLMEKDSDRVHIYDYELNLLLTEYEIANVGNKVSGSRLENQFTIYKLQLGDGSFKYIFINTIIN